MVDPIYPVGGATHAIDGAVQWGLALLTGSLSTSIAVVAIAGLGFAMLQGDIPVRRATRFVLGCFILFGAPMIAQALLTTTARIPSGNSNSETATLKLPPQPTPRSAPNPFDPNSGSPVH